MKNLLGFLGARYIYGIKNTLYVFGKPLVNAAEKTYNTVRNMVIK